MSVAKNAVVSAKVTNSLPTSLRDFSSRRPYAHRQPIMTSKLENHAGSAISRSGRPSCPVWNHRDNSSNPLSKKVAAKMFAWFHKPAAENPMKHPHRLPRKLSAIAVMYIQA